MTATHPPGPGLAIGPAVRWSLTAVATIVTVVALGLPALVFVRGELYDGKVLAQHDSPSPALTPATRRLAGDVSATRPDAPLVLAYHDIRPQAPKEEPEDVYTVTPAQFAAQMEALDDAGYRTISSSQFASWLAGGRLPQRAVYLTFDDGTSGLWRYADRVLAEHDFRAAAFIITGRIGTHRPYYLSWDELRRMQDNGRWDLESHTRGGHGRIRVNEQGELEPFLINRAWLPAKGRLETVDELTARVRTDVVGAKHDLVAHGLRTPRFFAYPFSAETRPTNDDKVPGEVARILRHEYLAAFSNVEPDRLVSERDVRQRTLSRLEVFRFTTPEGLLARAKHADPLDPAAARPLASPSSWVDQAGRSFTPAARPAAAGAAPVSPAAGRVTVDPQALTLRPDPNGYVTAAYAPGRTEDWRDFATTATVHGLGARGTGIDATLTALYGSVAPVELSVSAGYARLQVADATVAEQRLAPADHHRLELRTTAGAAEALVDGRRLGSAAVDPAASGGIALGASDGDGDAATPSVSFAGLGVTALADPTHPVLPVPSMLTVEDRAAMDGRPIAASVPDVAPRQATPVEVPKAPAVTVPPVTVPKPAVTVPKPAVTVPKPKLPSTKVPVTTTPTVAPAPSVPDPSSGAPVTTVPTATTPTTAVTAPLPAPTTTIPTTSTTVPATEPTTVTTIQPTSGHRSRDGGSGSYDSGA